MSAKLKIIWKKIKKILSRPFFWTVLSGLGGLYFVIKFFGEIVRFIISQSAEFWRIFNQTVPIYIVLFIFVFILIVLLLIKLRKHRLNEKEMFILGILDEREIGLNLLFKLYKQRFEKESRTMSHCLITIKQLEMKKLIKCAALSGGINSIQDELFQLTEKGQKRFEKLDSTIREKSENIYNKLLAMAKPEELDPAKYAWKIEVSVSTDTNANGDIYLFLDNTWLGSPNDLKYSPLPDNSGTSKGTVSFWETIYPGTHTLTFRLAHYNDFVEGQITPGSWVIKMIISGNLNVMICGAVQEQNIGLWKVGQDQTFTFSIQ